MKQQCEHIITKGTRIGKRCKNRPRLLINNMCYLHVASSWHDFNAKQRPGVYVKSKEDVFVVGDLHGDLEMTKRVLNTCGLTRETGENKVEWIGGTKMVIQLGDILDRGPSSKSMIRFCMDVEKQAFLKGGRFIMTLGNHEVMNLAGITRYASPGDDQEWGLVPTHKFTDREMREKGEQFDTHRGNVIANSVEGMWLKKQPVVVRVGKDLFAHADPFPVSGKTLDDPTIDSVNADMFEMLHQLTLPSGFNITSQKRIMSVFPHLYNMVWSRELSKDTTEMCTRVADSMGIKDSSTHITRAFVGHTTQTNGLVKSVCSGNVVIVDTGLSMYSHSLDFPHQDFSWKPVYKTEFSPQVARISHSTGRIQMIDIARSD
jgi:hypothetical protein